MIFSNYFVRPLLIVVYLTCPSVPLDAATRLDSAEWRAVASMRVLIGLLQSKFLYGTMVSFSDPRTFCRSSREEELSEAEIRRKLEERADRVDPTKVCFHRIVGFSTKLSMWRKAYAIKLKTYRNCEEISNYLLRVLNDRSKIQSMGLDKHVLIHPNGELEASREDISIRIALATNYFEFGAVKARCATAESELLIGIPVQP